MLQHRLIWLIALLLPWKANALTPVEHIFQEQLAHVQTFKAHYEQRTINAKGLVVLEEQGEVVLKRPGKLHWQPEPLDSPEVYADGKRLLLRYRDLMQATIRPLQAHQIATPAGLLMAPASELAQAFYVEKGAQSGQFKLFPKHMPSIEKILLRFQAGQLTEIAIYDNLANLTEVRFIKPSMNGAMPDSQFKFPALTGYALSEAT